MSGLIKIDAGEISTEINADFDDLTKGAEFLKRVQLVSKGKYVDKGKIRPGHWGIPGSGDEIFDIGDEMNILVLARRAKAIDFSDREDIVTSFDDKSEEFKRIREESAGKDTGCMFGVSFLIFEQSTGSFLEYFMATKTSRPVAKELYPFMLRVEGGKVVQPEPITMKTEYIENVKYPFHAPIVAKCSTPFTNVPDGLVIAGEINKFVNPKTDTETVEEPKSSKRAR